MIHEQNFDEHIYTKTVMSTNIYKNVMSMNLQKCDEHLFTKL